MPELPDVEVFGRRIRAHGLNRRIETVDLRDPDRLRGASPADLEAALRGYVFEDVTRHGKMLFVKVSCGWQLVMHFGMTGFVTFYDDLGEEPEHARLVLGFQDGGENGGWFAFDDQRRLGWLELTDDIPSYLRSQGIGPDALSFDLAAFRALLTGKRGMVKTALMDQARIAGIGNVYSDEILFQAGARPDRKAMALTDSEIEAIHDRMHTVLTKAAEHEADPARMPRGWLTPLRGAEAPCPRCGGPLDTLKVGGRTAYFCPNCQE